MYYFQSRNPNAKVESGETPPAAASVPAPAVNPMWPTNSSHKIHNDQNTKLISCSPTKIDCPSARIDFMLTD